LTEIIGVRFNQVGKIYYFDPCGLKFQEGDHVVVETSRGIELCLVALNNREVDDSSLVQPLRKVIRAATQEDLELVERNKERAKEAFHICEQKIAAHKLEMKLIEAEYAFDGSKVLFYFTAENRVDFRELVKDLAGVFKMRVELRQIGVRDEAKMYGGLGICGRPFCCASFLDDFVPVSIKMAKEQNLSLNPTKISGTCGRLMCCLKYEQEAYEDLLKTTPKLDTLVQCPGGVGKITEINLLRGMCKVRLENSTEAPKSYHKSELNVLTGVKDLPKADRAEKTDASDALAAALQRKLVDALDTAATDTAVVSENAVAVQQDAPAATPRRSSRHGGRDHHSNGEKHADHANPATEQGHSNRESANANRENNGSHREGNRPPRSSRNKNRDAGSEHAKAESGKETNNPENKSGSSANANNNKDNNRNRHGHGNSKGNERSSGKPGSTAKAHTPAEAAANAPVKAAAEATHEPIGDGENKSRSRNRSRHRGGRNHNRNRSAQGSPEQNQSGGKGAVPSGSEQG